MDFETINFRNEPRRVASGQLVVKVAEGQSHSDVLDRVLGLDSHRVVHPPDARGICLIELTGVADLATLADRLEQDASIIYAEPNDQTEQAQVVAPDDPLLSTQWALGKINALAGWQYSSGSPKVLLAVADSGLPIQNGVLTHPELSDPRRFIIGPDFTGAANGSIDDNGHGTHVLGIAAARARNSEGIAGLAYSSRTLSLKVFDASGFGSVFALYQAAQYAVNEAAQLPSRLILNYSGQSRGPHPLYEEVAQTLQAAGAILCAAAGNDADYVGFPAALSPRFGNIVAVSATDTSDELASFSNRGPEVTVSAPGVSILSTFPNYEVPGKPLSYGELSGTSMSTPLVSALAALVWTAFEFYDAERVCRRLEKTAVDLGPPGRDDLFGYGRIDVQAAMELMPFDRGEPIPKPQPWPNAPHPPPSKPVVLAGLHSLGTSAATALRLAMQGHTVDAGRRMQAIKRAALSNAVFSDLTTVDAAIAEPTSVLITSAIESLRTQLRTARLFKAVWLSLAGIFDTAYFISDADLKAGYSEPTESVIASLEQADRSASEVGVYGPALLQIEDVKEQVKQSGGDLEAVRIIREWGESMSNAIRGLTGVYYPAN